MNCHAVILVALTGMVTGCAAPRPSKPAAQPAAKIVPDERLHGRIATVNMQGQFVVVDFNVGAIPPLQSQLNVYRGNVIVGAVWLSGPVRDNLVAGDLVNGEAAVGDVAIWDGAKAKAKAKDRAKP